MAYCPSLSLSTQPSSQNRASGSTQRRSIPDSTLAPYIPFTPPNRPGKLSLMESERRSKRARVSGAHQALAANANSENQGMVSDHQCGQTYKVPGYVVYDHTFRLPLDYSGRVSGEISLFAREVVSPSKVHQQLPYLLYLQGGPGFAATLPVDGGPWLRAATNYFRVILLDQRGTGRSTPVSCGNLVKKGKPAQQAQYLTFFRADSIVKDAERVRKTLVPSDIQSGRWSVLGQSFGGFCCIHYLSTAPEGLSEVLLTGGVPPLIAEENPAEEVYYILFHRVKTQNEKYYERFPMDVHIVSDIVKHLMQQEEGGVRLPSGSLLTPRSFQLLGCSGLGFAGGFERLHFLLESAFDGDELSYRFMKGYESWMTWETNPLYVLLHEPIYSQGKGGHWAAQRVRDKHFKDQFDAELAVKEGRPVYFTGEMVFPWMFDDFKELQPLKEASEIVQSIDDWTKLYDIEVLKENRVPVASATYCEDMYVDFNLAQQTIQHIKGLRQWMTNEYQHSGIRDDGGRIFEKLMAMARDSLLLS